MFTCPKCRDEYPDYYRAASGLCDECDAVKQLPRGARKRERYRFDEAIGHSNATCRLTKRVPLSERAVAAGKRPR